MCGQSTQQCVSIKSYRKGSPALTCYYGMFKSIQILELSNEKPAKMILINEKERDVL